MMLWPRLLVRIMLMKQQQQEVVMRKMRRQQQVPVDAIHEEHE
jgi:hypothetical protein